MPVRIRLTLLFAVLVTIILCLVCGSIYYFAYTARENTIKTRLTNRAITTARLLMQEGTFNRSLVQKIDSLTTISLKDKTVQAYDRNNVKFYSYSEEPGDTFSMRSEELEKARADGTIFYAVGNREVVAHAFTGDNIEFVVVTAANDEVGKASLETLRKILLLSLLLGNIFVLVAGYIFSSEILGPIKKITADVEDISAQNLARRIKPGSSKDEWYKLATTLNRLLDRLQDSFELQRRFISNASHELSTPLTSISSQLQVSLLRERDSASYKKVMQSVYSDVQQMSKLVQTLLEFAKASGDSGGLEINLVRIDEIILGLPAEIAKIDPGFSVTLEFEKLPEEDKSLLVFGNETLLTLAIKNIVVNACKYSNDRKARILLSIIEHEVVINIVNCGKGIPEQELENIFQPFYRVEEKSASKGFGLGLSLAKRIIILHKGSIAASSKIDDSTTFSISLPTANSLRQF